MATLTDVRTHLKNRLVLDQGGRNRFTDETDTADFHGVNRVG
jgi:hypothetical protein